MLRSASLLLFSAFVVAGCGGGSSGSSSSKVRFEEFASESGLPVPTALTADGASVVGYVPVGDDFEPLIWNDPARPQTISNGGGTPLQYVVAVSRNGGTLLGAAKLVDGSWRAVLSSLQGVQTSLPLPDGATASYPVDLSGDGTVALCTDAPQSTPFSPRPFVVRNGVATYLPLPVGATTAGVQAISADGTTVVGSADGKAVRWVNEGYPEVLADGAVAHDVNRDGTVVVGSIYNVPIVDSLPFRWTALGGAQTLSTPSGYPRQGEAEGVSDDGKTVLLNASDSALAQQFEVFLWKDGVGSRALVDLFAASGGRRTGFTAATGTVLSADGKTILGRGKRSDVGVLAAPWKLTLP